MKFLNAIYLLLFTYSLSAQEIKSQAAWQQQANYTITVTLNDDSNYLTGFETIEYFNNSPATLSEICIHLYPNAYRDNLTAFAREKIAQSDTKFWMSDDKERGFITDLNFVSEGQNLELKYSSVSPDMAKLILKKPLLPGKSMIITTPFVVKIPYTFSRMGHVGQSYQISQWFPKIAVYDVIGWNQIPYLDQGEFYSDYGNYDVKITLPKNYIVAATGDLQDEEELTWMKNRVNGQRKITDEFKNDELKTLHFKENNIHDFAFFADKRWCIAMDEVSLASGKVVTAWAFDTIYAEAEKGVNFIKRTILYLSDHVGEYPYNTAKSCTGALVSGAGMEYPTVTIVGQQHEAEVVHEIGHNWFYGILASNERRSPWMDEGINTYYQLKIGQEKEKTIPKKAMKRVMGDEFEYSEANLLLLIGKINSSRAEDAPITLHATKYSSTNYGALVYYRTAFNFNYLQAYLGDSLFDASMKYYFKQWHHKHPLPDDIKNCFNTITGKNLSWFFDGMINEKQNYDFSIYKVIKENQKTELEIYIKNKTGKPIALPIFLSGLMSSQTYWIEPFIGDTIVHFHNDNYSKIELNNKPYYIEINQNNNYYFLNKTIHRSCPVQIRTGVGLENKYHRTLFIVPLSGRNAFNKYMLGIGVFNSSIIRKKLEYLIAPLYSFEKGNINGYSHLSYTFMPKKEIINTWNIAVKGAKFNSRYNGSPLVYTRIQPFAQVNFTRPSDASRLERFLRLDYTRVNEKKENNSDSFTNNSKQFLNLQYSLANKTLLNPYNFRIMLEKNLGDAMRSYFKVSLKAEYKLSYDNPKKNLDIEFFAGQVFNNNDDGHYDFHLSAESPRDDYKYWYAILNRDPADISQQIFNNEGGMRSNVESALHTSQLSGTLRLRTHIPLTNVIRPYIDFGTYRGIEKDHQTKLVYTSGISVVILDDIIEINFPLAIVHSYDLAGNTQYEVMKSFKFAQSGAINEATSAQNLRYWQTVSFLFNLDKLSPIYWIRNFPLGK